MEQSKKMQFENKQMDLFFGVNDKKHQPISKLNLMLLELPKEKLVTACHSYGLYPVYTYMDIGKLKAEETPLDIRGFIRYMDTYLIEISGGNRQQLIQLGEKLTGQQPISFSLRLLRLEIISSLLTQILKQPI